MIAPAAPTSLRIRWEGRELVLVPGSAAAIGRDEANDIRCHSPFVSGRHAELVVENGVWTLVDRASKRGVRVDDQRQDRVRITGPVAVWLGDDEGGQSITLEPLPTPAGEPPKRPASTTSTQRPPTVRVSVGGTDKTFTSVDEITIGRAEDCDVRVDSHHEQVSRRHATLRIQGVGWVLHDWSRHGTFHHGRPVSTLSIDGDVRVRLGDPDVGPEVAIRTARRPEDTTALRPRVRARLDSSASGTARADPIGHSTVQRLVGRVEQGARRTRVLTAAIVAVLVVAAGALAFAVGNRRWAAPTEADVVEQASPATVEIVAVEAQTGGTGWVLDAEQGLIVTNAHVVSGAETHEVIVDGEGREAALLAVAPCEDLAMLRVRDTSALRTLPLGDQKKVRRGDRVIALGYATNAGPGGDLVSTLGSVSTPRTTWTVPGDVPELANVVQTDAAINPGNSGGPLVNLAGELVGVNTAVLSESIGDVPRNLENQGYAIGVDRVRSVVPALRRGESLAWTGMWLETVVADDGGEQALGLEVAGVYPGTAADEAGIGERALLVAVNGQQVGTTGEYCDAVQDHVGGDPVEVTLLDRGGQRTVEMTFE